MAAKPLKEVIGLDERFGWNRGEYLHVCCDGLSKIVAVPISVKRKRTAQPFLDLGLDMVNL
jgi:hypothetical protein